MTQLQRNILELNCFAESRFFLAYSNGWVDCWKTPYVFLSVTYTYYPMPVLLSQTPSDGMASFSLTGDFMEEESNLLSQLQPGCSRTSQSGHVGSGGDGQKLFDPGLLKPDLIQVELEVAPSTLILYGSLLRNLVHLKVRSHWT